MSTSLESYFQFPQDPISLNLSLPQKLFRTLCMFRETHRYMEKADQTPELLKQLKLEWANKFMSMYNAQVEVIGEPCTDKSVIFLGNHISYLDIPLLMSLCENICFVAKKEVGDWPFFGRGARIMGTVLVNRGKKDSRAAARLAIEEALSKGKRIALFPSGTTCMRESKEWRRGAFEIAYHTKSRIQPFRLIYSPLREVAYIDKDTLMTHLLNLIDKRISVKIEFHPPVEVTDPESDRLKWQQWAQEFVNT